MITTEKFTRVLVTRAYVRSGTETRLGVSPFPAGMRDSREVREEID